MAPCNPETVHVPQQAAPPNCVWSDLESADPSRRVRALRALGGYGSHAVTLLCKALTDSDLRVSTAAAEALRHVGDESCVTPLATALKISIETASSSQDRQLKLLVLGTIGGVVGMLALLRVGTSFLESGAGLPAPVAELHPWNILLPILVLGFGAVAFVQATRYRAVRRQTSRFTEAAATALGRIAERHPTVGLRQALPFLQAAQRDRLFQVSGAREAADRAILEIEWATRNLHDLPLSAAGEDPSDLPIPGFPAEDRTDCLPVATTE